MARLVELCMVGLIGVGVLGAGCKRTATPYYADPEGRFQILPFEAKVDLVDAAGTTHRHARIDVAVAGGDVEHVTWQEEEYADGATDNWKWTLTDEKTGVRRIYTASSSWRRASVSDGRETHTTAFHRAGRARRVRVDGADYRDTGSACSALAKTPLCEGTPPVFAYVRSGLLSGKPLPRNSVDVGNQGYGNGRQSFAPCLTEKC